MQGLRTSHPFKKLTIYLAIHTLRPPLRTRNNSKRTNLALGPSRFQQPPKVLNLFWGNNQGDQSIELRILKRGFYLQGSILSSYTRRLRKKGQKYSRERFHVEGTMHKKHTAESILVGKDNFMVTVNPYIDYAFIVAVIVILDEINHAGTS
ncbi:Protein LURP-one-related 15 [Morella rubra]|uniref:Protein LURP-one-related 15 n=1 Tax=Morella rubra TaxID=262757 RepID=A0A6A1WL00_9ROSI|nr:Protein LURP-one-related 15 [Morella rubra]